MFKKAILIAVLSLSVLTLSACSGEPSQPFCDRLDRNVKAQPGVNCIPIVGNTKGSNS